MKNIKALILSNQQLASGRFFKIRLEAPSICKLAKPGQFVMVKCSGRIEPFLRRPFSFHRITKDYFELLYQVVGRGTKILSQTKKGERLDIIGPLGNGFTTDHERRRTNHRLLVGGGIGVAPLLELARRLKVKGLPFKVLLGARTKNHILCEEDFKRLGAEVKISTEDGSKGYQGLITALLRKRLNAIRYPLNAIIYACGPKEMLKEINSIAKSKEVPCQISLEEKMACGTGACLSCAVRTVTGFKMVCKDGPIFSGGDIIW